MLLVVVFQQGQSIATLKSQVSVLKLEVDQMQEQHTSVKLSDLSHKVEFLQTQVSGIFDSQLKRDLAYCKTFPHAKNCPELLAMFVESVK